MSASEVPERSAEALLCQPEVINLHFFTFTRGTGKMSIDFCPTRLQSIVSALPYMERLNVSQRSARACVVRLSCVVLSRV